MHIEQLRYFLETVRRGHPGEAARALYVTPSAVSHGIARLEEELDVELFRKQVRKLTLTGEGTALLEGASDVLGRLDRLHEITRTPPAEAPSRIAAAHGLAAEDVARHFGAAWADGTFRAAELSAAKLSDVLAAVAHGLRRNAFDNGRKRCFPRPKKPLKKALRNGRGGSTAPTSWRCTRT